MVALQAADLDQDGRADLVATGPAGALRFRAGTPGFTPWPAAGAEPAIRGGALAALDFDLEGDLDLALAGAGAPGGELLRSAAPDPLVALGARVLPALALGGVRRLLASDLDRDGDPDLVAAGDGGLFWLDNLRQGRFADRTGAAKLAGTGPLFDVARERGWEAESLGANVPREALVRIVVQLPPSFGEGNARRYPVLYFLHDGFGSEETLAKRGIASRLDAEMAAGRLPEMLVVSPRGVGTWFTDSHDGKVPMLLGFVVAKHARGWSEKPEAQRRALLLQLVLCRLHQWGMKCAPNRQHQYALGAQCRQFFYCHFDAFA